MTDPTPSTIDLSKDAPEDIRAAVEQLSFGYRRGDTKDPSADLVRDAERRIEAILFAADRPVSAEDLVEALPQGIELAPVLMSLQRQYAARGVNLVEVAGSWRFQTAEDLAFLFVESREEQKKLSQAALETLSIIAYCQPVTRSEIEDVRGVAVSKGTLDVLMDAGWVRFRGRRRTPGRPVTYGTTDAFLEYFGLDSLETLPGKAEFQAMGLLDSDIPANFEMPQISGEEDPLEDPDHDASEGDPSDFHIDFMDEDAPS